MTTDDKIQYDYDSLSEEDKMRWYEEKKRKAEEIYEAEIRHLIGPEDEDKYVKIDVLTGDYEIHENAATASIKLRERRPDAVIHTMHRHKTRVIRWVTPRIVRKEKANE